MSKELIRSFIKRLVLWAMPELKPKELQWQGTFIHGDDGCVQPNIPIQYDGWRPSKIILPKIKAGFVRLQDFPQEPIMEAWYPMSEDKERRIVIYGNIELINKIRSKNANG